MSGVPGPERLTTADVAHAPAPGLSFPARFAFSPDDRWVTYLHSPKGDLTRELFVFDTETLRAAPVFATSEPPDEELPLEERLRKERARELSGGVTRYSWARSGPGS